MKPVSASWIITATLVASAVSAPVLGRLRRHVRQAPDAAGVGVARSELGARRARARTSPSCSSPGRCRGVVQRSSPSG
ncbi:MFS transporter [Pseudonocardia sp. MCCB 268]|nr:MFS transporter [Pseudonocardia cytotoxica]